MIAELDGLEDCSPETGNVGGSNLPLITRLLGLGSCEPLLSVLLYASGG